MKYKRVSVHVSTLAVLLAGIITLVGCTGVMTNERPTPQTTLNPNSVSPSTKASMVSSVRNWTPSITVFHTAGK